MQALLARAGQKLHLQLRAAPRTELKGVLVPLPEGASLGPAGGAIVNLSFGISVVDAVAEFALTSADFAATDLAVEMLYLVEAKSAAMQASRMLNLRLQGAKIAAEEQAFTDTLTGLKNRRAMDHVLGRLIEGEVEFALVHLDLDYFKAVNDTLGHAAGDHVLQQAARIMVSETRRQDTVIRTGGDEFVLIFSGLTDPARLDELARRLIARLEEPILYEDQPCLISGSIGATLSVFYPHPEIDRMMEDADTALYAAKHAGRGLPPPAQAGAGAALGVSWAQRRTRGYSGAFWGRPAMKSAARAAIICVGAFRLALVMRGMTEASTTRSPSTPLTRHSPSTTALASGPIRQVQDGWKSVVVTSRSQWAISSSLRTCGPGIISTPPSPSNAFCATRSRHLCTPSISSFRS